MRKITFKRPDDQINIGGQVIGSWNITPEKYDELVAIAPAHADHFNVVEVDEEGNPLPAEEKSDTDKPEKPTRRRSSDTKE